MEINVTSQLFKDCIIYTYGTTLKTRETKLAENGALVVRNWNERVSNSCEPKVSQLQFFLFFHTN